MMLKTPRNRHDGETAPLYNQKVCYPSKRIREMISTSTDSLSDSVDKSPSRITISRKTHLLWTLGIMFVLAGQIVLLKIHGGDPRDGLKQAIAGSLLILGACLFGAFTKAFSSSISRFDFSTESTRSSTFVWRETWILGSLFTSFTLAALAIFLFVEYGESRVVVLSWIASILFLFIASLGNFRIARPRFPQDWMYLAALAGLLVVAAFTRIYKLTTLPYNFDGDFASVGLEARALLTGQ